MCVWGGGGTGEGESALGAFSCRMAEGEPQPAARAGRWAARTRVQPLTYVCIAKRLLRVHRGAAAGVGRAQQRGQQQEAERQPEAAGRGAHGGRAGGLGPAAGARAGAPGTPLLTWPAPPRKLSVLFVKGRSGEGTAQGSAPGGEERGWGAASERSPARLLRCLLWLCLLRARAEPPFYCAPRILCSSSRWLAASAGRALPAALLPRRAAQPSPEPRLLLCPAWHRLRASRTTWHAAPQSHARCVPDCALGWHLHTSGHRNGQL